MNTNVHKLTRTEHEAMHSANKFCARSFAYTITPRQLGDVKRIAREYLMDVDKECHIFAGCAVRFLCKTKADKFISELQKKADETLQRIADAADQTGNAAATAVCTQLQTANRSKPSDSIFPLEDDTLFAVASETAISEAVARTASKPHNLKIERTLPHRYLVVSGKSYYETEFKSANGNTLFRCSCPRFVYKQAICRHVAAILHSHENYKAAVGVCRARAAAKAAAQTSLSGTPEQQDAVLLRQIARVEKYHGIII